MKKSAMRKSELYFEELGDRFDSYMSDYDVDRRIELILHRLWPKNTAVRNCLEVGCGTGRISRAVYPRVEKLTVCDLSGGLASSVARTLSCEFSQEDACELSFLSDNFDIVVSSECIEHTRSPYQAIEEMIRVTRPGGYIVVTTPNRLWFPVLQFARLARLRKFDGNEIWLWPLAVKSFLRRKGCLEIKFAGCHLLPWQIPLIKQVLPVFDRLSCRIFLAMINFGFSARKQILSNKI